MREKRLNIKSAVLIRMAELLYFSMAGVFAFTLANADTVRAEVTKAEPVLFAGHYYQVFSRNEMNWDEAAAFCRDKGGYLASITSAAEDQFTYSYVRQNGYVSVLFGLTDQETEGVWSWQNGENFGYSNWADGEPNGGQSENYAMYYEAFTDGTWNDGAFDVEGILCEWNQKPGLGKEIGYQGHRYQLFRGASSWQEARQYCEKLGGYLAIPDNAGEDKAIYQYVRSNGNRNAYFGIYDKGNNNWVTVKGDSPSYVNWAWGEPSDPEEPYAMYYWKFTDGSWNDGAFSEHTDNGGYDFVCEWGEDAPSVIQSKKDLSKAVLKLSPASFKYNGQARKPKVTVTLNGKKVTASGYSVKYSSNKYVGTAKVTVTGKKGYTGQKTKIFKIKNGGTVVVAFDANGGSVSKKSAKVQYGARYGSLPSATRSGYTLKGWYTKKSGGKAVNKDTQVTSSKAHTLYAVWKKNAAKTETKKKKNTAKTDTKKKNNTAKTEAKKKIYGCVISGCNDAQNGYTKDSATDFYKKLIATKIDGYTVNSSTVKLHIVNAPAPSRNELEEWIIKDFINAKEDDLSFVYYCGHGRGGGENGKGLGISLRDNQYDGYYSYSRFLDYLGQNISGRIVLVVDACFSGGFVKAAADNRKVENRICVMASSLDTQPTDSYLKIGMDLKWPHMLKMAAVIGQAVIDTITKSHHQYHCFTYAIMEGLNWSRKKDFPADTNGDHVVTCYELKQYVSNHMPDVTGEIPRFYLAGGRMTNQPVFGW